MPPVDLHSESPPARRPRVRSAIKVPRRKARRVHRVVRHVDVWGVLKIALIFYACVYVIVLVAGVLLWQGAERSETVSRVEGFVAEAGEYERWEFVPEAILRGYAVIGGVGIFVLAAFTVLFTLLFNLISDLTGGVGVTVIESETAIVPVEPPAGSGSEPVQPTG